MLPHYSLSSNASIIRYSIAYKDFDPTKNYIPSKGESTFIATKDWWKKRIEGYEQQDLKAGRDAGNNVRLEDFEYYKDLIQKSKCALCGQPFTSGNAPTLDRIDNTLGHTKENCQLTCYTCNREKSNLDSFEVKIKKNIYYYALEKQYPFTIGKQHEEAYHILRRGITGGLSNVQHRINMKGITRINKLYYDPVENVVSNKDTNNIMTNFVGVDFNSLYPSVFSSSAHPFIKYTGGKMYMPGKIKKFLICDDEKKKAYAREVIAKQDTLFVAEILGEIPKEYINEFINFLPIFRNIEITTDEDTLGSFMYNYMKENNLPIDKKERKLTQLASTNGEYMIFSSYYLWYLMDRFHFVIQDIKSIILFTKNTFSHDFATQFMKTRQEAELEGKKGKGMFCKISLNGSYGYDAMNTQKYMKSKICNEEKTIKSQRKQNFVNTIPLGEDVYQVIYKPKTYKCKTPLQVALFTLDNAKYWYLVFIYDFLFKCVDTNRLHFIEGDTDSMYWAIAGDNKLDNTQAFQSIIVNKEFYDENIFKFAPFDFFCYNEGVRPKFSTKSEEKAHEKKLLGLAIEKQGDNMIALCPKCYTSFNDDKKTIALKMKGVNRGVSTIRPDFILSSSTTPFSTIPILTIPLFQRPKLSKFLTPEREFFAVISVS